MRRGTSISIAVAILVLLPASALGASRSYIGFLSDVANPSAQVAFTAIGKVNRKGVFKPTRVKGLSVSDVPYTCETPSHEVTTARRSDLPWASLGLLSVDKRGGFSGRFDPATDSSFQVTGGFHKGKASGSLLGYEGTAGVTTTCTTSLHRWTARPVKLVCGSATPAGPSPLCTGPPRS